MITLALTIAAIVWFGSVVVILLVWALETPATDEEERT